MRQYAVDAHRAQIALALAASCDSGFAGAFNKGVPHVCERRLAVGITFMLHLDDEMFNCVNFILRQAQLLQHRLIAFDQLGSSKMRRDAGGFRVIFDHVADRMDGAVHRAGTEILSARFLLTGCDIQQDMHQFADAFALARGNRDDRDAERFRQRRQIDAHAVGAHLIHHIDRDDGRCAQLKQLER